VLDSFLLQAIWFIRSRCVIIKVAIQVSTAAVGHSNLGLALVEALVRIMGLKVNLALDEKGNFLVNISGQSAA